MHFSIQLDFTPTCIVISKVSEIEYSQRISRTSAASEIELFMIIVYSFKSSTIFTENSVLDVRGPGSTYDNVRFINDIK